MIIFENKDYDDVIGNPQAPFINSLAVGFGVADQSYALMHPSLPNYFALTGGDTFGVTDDCPTNDCFVNAPNIADSVEQAGLTWKAYMEDMPSPCYVGDAGTYSMHHDPFVYYDDIRTDSARCSSHVVPLTDLSTDLSAGTLPDYVWITPNLQDDMHDGTVQQGDQWLGQWASKLMDSPQWKKNGMIILTWDEGNTDGSCCGIANGGHIPTLILQPNGPHSGHSSMQITEYNVLRTASDALGVAPVGHAADTDVLPLGSFVGG